MPFFCRHKALSSRAETAASVPARRILTRVSGRANRRRRSSACWGIMVPHDLGGEGASISDVVDVLLSSY